ncbi:22676_t:CDS:1, partial [Cetraspora pellucida]
TPKTRTPGVVTSIQNSNSPIFSNSLSSHLVNSPASRLVVILPLQSKKSTQAFEIKNVRTTFHFQKVTCSGTINIISAVR